MSDAARLTDQKARKVSVLGKLLAMAGTHSCIQRQECSVFTNIEPQLQQPELTCFG